MYHHGLKNVPEKVLDYIKDGVFFDAGGCYGDSALMFHRFYSPGKVVTFEPFEQNRKIYTEHMRLNGINQEAYSLLSCGLGAEKKTIYCKDELGGSGSLLESRGDIAIEVKTLDEVCKKDGISNVKVIKSDIEGMGLQMLLGAEETIRKNRPVLLLSIYHNQEEFFGIYETLKKWNLNYNYSIRHCFPFPAELTLIGYPQEILSENK